LLLGFGFALTAGFDFGLGFPFGFGFGFDFGFDFGFPSYPHVIPPEVVLPPQSDWESSSVVDCVSLTTSCCDSSSFLLSLVQQILEQFV